MSKIMTQASYGLAFFGCGLILLVAFVTIGNSISRAVLGVSVYGVNDLFTLLTFTGLTACFPLAMLQRVHMRVTILGEALGTGPRLWLEVFASLVTFGFLIVLTARFARRAQDLGQYGEVSDIARIPLAPWWWVTTGLLAVAALVQLYVMITDPRHYRQGGAQMQGSADV